MSKPATETLSVVAKGATTTTKKRGSGSMEGKAGDSPSQLIDARIRELSDWRGETLARVRILIKQADAEVVEEWKWRGVPVWSHAGIICTGETYKSVVKLTFAKGASLEDPAGLFNSSLDGNTRRAIDFYERTISIAQFMVPNAEGLPFPRACILLVLRHAGQRSDHCAICAYCVGSTRRRAECGYSACTNLGWLPLGGKSRRFVSV